MLILENVVVPARCQHRGHGWFADCATVTATTLIQQGVDVASIGDAHSRTPGARNYTFCDEVAEVYKRLVVSAATICLVWKRRMP